MAIPRLSIEFSDSAQNGYRQVNTDGTVLYRIGVRNESPNVVDGVRVRLHRIEPVGHDAASRLADANRLHDVPLMVIHGDNCDSLQTEFSINPRERTLFNLIQETPSRHQYDIYHACGFAREPAADCHRMRVPDGRIPKGKYRLEVQVTSRQTEAVQATFEAATESDGFTLRRLAGSSDDGTGAGPVSHQAIATHRATSSATTATGVGPGIWIPPSTGLILSESSDQYGALEREGEDAAAQLKIYANFVNFVDGLALDPQAEGIRVTDLTGMATGFSKWNAETSYKAILNSFSNYAKKYRQKHGISRQGVIRSFFVDPSVLDPVGLTNLKTILEKHVALGIGAQVVILGSGVPSDCIGDLGIYHANIADEFLHLERVNANAPRPQANYIDRKDNLSQFKDIEAKLRWTDKPQNGSVLSIACEGELRECVTELARRANIKIPPVSRGK